jgi:hypothetical protein
MGKIINMLLALIAYFCVATVITLALIVGYMFHTDQLNNEKIFRLLAVVQDVDLQAMAAAEKKSPDEVPPQELSLNEVMHHQQVQDRNFEVKQLALQRGKQIYDDALQKLIVKSERFDRSLSDLKSRLETEQEQANQQNVATVVSQLEQVSPENGKNQILLWVAEKRMDDAILLMSRMSESKLKKILQAFEKPEELTQLHEIQLHIMSSGKENSPLDKALKELNAANNSG